MATRKRKPVAQPLPADFQEIMQELDLRVITYGAESVVVQGTHGERRLWLPEDVIGKDGKTLIKYGLHDDYPHVGKAWATWHDGVHGGVYNNIWNALAWVKRAKEVRAGTAQDFRGV